MVKHYPTWSKPLRLFADKTEIGSGFTYFEGNTIPYHTPIPLRKKDSQ